MPSPPFPPFPPRCLQVQSRVVVAAAVHLAVNNWWCKPLSEQVSACQFPRPLNTLVVPNL